MKRILLTALMALGLTTGATVAAQEVRVDTMRVWDNATAPHSNGLSGAERRPDADLVGNTTATELYIYRPVAARDMKLAVVICPGGGYEYLQSEGRGHGCRPLARGAGRDGRRAEVPPAERPSRGAPRGRRAGRPHHGRPRSRRHRYSHRPRRHHGLLGRWPPCGHGVPR